MPSPKIFGVTNRATGKIERVIKANTQGQVRKHLLASVAIEAMSAVELDDAIKGADLKVEDATAVEAGDAGDNGSDGGAPAGGTGGDEGDGASGTSGTSGDA